MRAVKAVVASRVFMSVSFLMIVSINLC
jgi:hypothetical protein